MAISSITPQAGNMLSQPGQSRTSGALVLNINAPLTNYAGDVPGPVAQPGAYNPIAGQNQTDTFQRNNAFSPVGGGVPGDQLQQAFLRALNLRNQAEQARNDYLQLGNQLDLQAAQASNQQPVLLPAMAQSIPFQPAMQPPSNPFSPVAGPMPMNPVVAGPAQPQSPLPPANMLPGFDPMLGNPNPGMTLQQPPMPFGQPMLPGQPTPPNPAMGSIPGMTDPNMMQPGPLQPGMMPPAPQAGPMGGPGGMPPIGMMPPAGPLPPFPMDPGMNPAFMNPNGMNPIPPGMMPPQPPMTPPLMMDPAAQGLMSPQAPGMMPPPPGMMPPGVDPNQFMMPPQPFQAQPGLMPPGLQPPGGMMPPPPPGFDPNQMMMPPAPGFDPNQMMAPGMMPPAGMLPPGMMLPGMMPQAGPGPITFGDINNQLRATDQKKNMMR